MALRRSPINTDHDEDVGGEIVAQSPDHHQHPATHVVQHPLHRKPPAGLQRHRDEGDQGVRDGQVEHQNVDVGATPANIDGNIFPQIDLFLPLRFKYISASSEENQTIENYPN